MNVDISVRQSMCSMVCIWRSKDNFEELMLFSTFLGSVSLVLFCCAEFFSLSGSQAFG